MTKRLRLLAISSMMFVLLLGARTSSATMVTVTATGYQANLDETITAHFTFDDQTPLSFSSPTVSQVTFSAPKPSMRLTSDKGLDLTLPILSITVRNDQIPAGDTVTLGIRDQINVFAIDAGGTQSAQVSVSDFLSPGSGNDPNNGLSSVSISAAFATLTLDPFLNNQPWSRGLVSLNGDISRQTEMQSIIATPLPAAGLLLVVPLAGMGLASSTRRRSDSRAFTDRGL